VVIDYFNIKCMAALKAETYTPLVVDADTVSTCSIAFERFEPVIGRNPQIVQLRRTVQHLQLALGNRPDIDKPGDPPAGKQSLRLGSSERLDRGEII
jgi:hypothetical protein